MSDTLQQYAKKVSEIYRTSNDEVIRKYLEFIDELQEQRALPFLMQGNLQWKEGNPDGLSDHGIWLKSNFYDPVGKHILANPVKNYLQMYCNTYEIVGKIEGNFSKTDLDSSKNEVETALHKLGSLRNAFSLLLGTSLTWYPARYLKAKVVNPSPPPAKEEREEWRFYRLQRSQEEHTSTIVEDAHVKSALQLAHHIQAIGGSLGARIRTALDWYSEGHKIASGLNRFVNLWASVELVAHYFYGKAKADVIARKTTRDKRSEVQGILDEKDKPILERVKDANLIIEPSVRHKMCALFNVLPNACEWEDELFAAAGHSKKSLYALRNDIAHGNFSERDFEEIASMRQRLHEMSLFARKFLISLIENLPVLENNIA